MIQADSLYFRYPDQPTHALNGLSFNLDPGRITLFSGPTGCGKSTLGLCLCGAIPHLINGTLSGNLRVNQKPVFTRTIRETAKDLGFLLQNVEHQIFAEQVSDEIAFGLENFQISKEDMEGLITEALDRVRAGHLATRTLSTLSTGERQRVMLAALLALDQPILVLDEPLAYLDQAAQQRWMALMSELSASGKTIVIFEHRRDVVRKVRHHEILMGKGRRTELPVTEGRFHKIGDYPAKNPELIFERVGFSRPTAPVPLFSELSFTVSRHESVVLLGKNGSGKTTLMAMAMGFLKSNRGKIITCGRQAAFESPAVLCRQAAFVFQCPDHQLFLPHVRDEIQTQSIDMATALNELSDMGLDGLENRHPRSLSTGQKRRLTLAAALARRPKLLLLDEPSVGQDDKSLSLIIRRLDRFLLEGGALLTATHDDRVARALAHRILKL
jgi:energy-coupling factor transport system ATP-binding protein